VIAALLTERSVIAAAQAAGIARSTLYRWLRQAHFQKALTEAEREVLRLASARAAGLLCDSLDVAGEGLRAMRLVDRLRAAGLLLRYGPKIREHGSLEDRLTQLEQRMR